MVTDTARTGRGPDRHSRVSNLLELRDLSIRYGSTQVLNSLNLTVGDGEIVALLGPSGSGKSTLLNAIAGFLPIFGGEILLAGRTVATRRHAEPPERRDIAFVFQDYGLWPHLTALDTVAYPLRRRGVRPGPARDQARDILERLGIGALADRKPAQLSGGEQQRVGLARAMARRAAVYLFDEPTAHLDAPLRDVFLAELAARRRESGAAAIYATHDAAEALGLADRVALLVDGQIVQDGSPQKLYAEPVNVQAARLSGPASLLCGVEGPLLVRPDWVRLGGDRRGVVVDVWFRGSYTDYVLRTADGELLLRTPAPPAHERGEEVRWSLDRCWPLPDADAARD
jgi:iron(III) transport system ATP-binding protein